MRKISGALVLLCAVSASAQEPSSQYFQPEELIEPTVYLHGLKEDVFAAGKMVRRAKVDLYLANYKESDALSFNPETDNLFIERFGRQIKAAIFDYEYLSGEIKPNHHMLLHFYLPQYKNITDNEVLYLTFNSTEDTLMVQPTEDEQIIRFVKNEQMRGRKDWMWKLGKSTLFLIAFIGLYALL